MNIFFSEREKEKKAKEVKEVIPDLYGVNQKNFNDIF